MIYLGTVRVGTFGVSVEVARLLGPVGTGAYGIALQVSGLATFVGAIGVGQALAQKLAQANHRARLSALTTTGFWIALVGSAFVGALLAFTSGPLARSAYRDASVATTLLWCGPLTLGGGLYLVAEGSLQGMRRFRALALWGVLVACADIGLGFAAAHLGIGFVYGARVLTRLVAAFVGLAVARRAIAHFDETSLAPGSATPVGDEMRTLFGFSLNQMYGVPVEMTRG